MLAAIKERLQRLGQPESHRHGWENPVPRFELITDIADNVYLQLHLGEIPDQKQLKFVLEENGERYQNTMIIVCGYMGSHGHSFGRHYLPAYSAKQHLPMRLLIGGTMYSIAVPA